MPLTLTESRVSNNQQFSEMLNDLQANILKHHGRNFAYHLFLAVKPGRAAEAKNWVAEFATSKITNTAKQIIDSEIRKRKGVDGGTVYNLSISSSGYDKLQIDPALKPDDLAFRDGIKLRSEKLADDPENWEKEFQNEIDILIIVAHANDAIAGERKDDLVVQLDENFELIKLQKGEILKNEGIGIEHFGYADGISQPIFFESEINKQSGHKQWRDEAKLSLALVKDKGGKVEDSYGSYLVFRKLEQNVKAFKDGERKLPKVKTKDGIDNKDLAGAMIVGRFEDGSEVVNSDTDTGITDEKDMRNDFDHSSDTNASKCPFHAHIRITNPRADIGDTGIDSFVRSVRLVRRGIPFNEINRIGTEGEPTSGVGLLFMCYQSGIEKQFEFIQSSWANHGDIGGDLVGQDGIIGQGQNNFQKKLPAQWGVNGKLNNCDFSNPNSGFVTMKGGEYFFTPSISFLRSLTINNNIMTKKVMEVTEVTLEIPAKDPSVLIINTKGMVNSGGWSKARLSPFVYVMPPADGIWEFDLIAEAPTGIVTQVILPIIAEPFRWESFPSDLKGVKVYASQNHITALKEEKIEIDRKLCCPFNKVTAEELAKLKSENDMFSITNAFIWEDVLHVSVQYGGGCKKHDLQLVWDGTEMESLPPQIPLFLIHNNNDDSCRAIVREDLQFILSSQIKTNAEIILDGWAKRLSFRIS